jgi:hypothetical protein
VLARSRVTSAPSGGLSPRTRPRRFADGSSIWCEDGSFMNGTPNLDPAYFSDDTWKHRLQLVAESRVGCLSSRQHGSGAPDHGASGIGPAHAGQHLRARTSQFPRRRAVQESVRRADHRRQTTDAFAGALGSGQHACVRHQGWPVLLWRGAARRYRRSLLWRVLHGAEAGSRRSRYENPRP